ncbi:MAG: hypothetical protein ABJA71_05370 [Ginsengibacter sp.]
MRTIIFSAIFLFAVLTGFSQASEENGIIYIKHPYIDVVNKSMQAYRDKDIAVNSNIFADTAKFFLSGRENPVPIADALKDWATDFDYYNDIKVEQVGYPDYLHYKDKDQKFVQSWWLWTGKSKKTAELVKINFIQLDKFNIDGKIDFESIYGDFSKLVKN